VLVEVAAVSPRPAVAPVTAVGLTGLVRTRCRPQRFATPGPGIDCRAWKRVDADRCVRQLFVVALQNAADGAIATTEGGWFTHAARARRAESSTLGAHARSLVQVAEAAARALSLVSGHLYVVEPKGA
jgi:hypothetical protein